MKRFKLYVSLLSLLLCSFSILPTQAADSEVTLVANSLAGAINVNPTRLGSDIFSHWLQKTHPEVSINTVFFQNYITAAEIYKDSEVSCVTMNPDVLKDPFASNFKVFKGSICNDVMRALSPYMSTYNYTTFVEDLLKNMQGAILTAASTNKSRNNPEFYLANAFKAAVFPPELTPTITAGELVLTYSIAAGIHFELTGLLFKLTVSKDSLGSIYTKISNLTAPNIFGPVNAYTGEILVASPYTSENTAFTGLTGREQLTMGLKTILNGILLDKFNARGSEVETFFTSLAGVITAASPTATVKALGSHNFEITTDAGMACLVLSNKITSYMVYSIINTACSGVKAEPLTRDNLNLINHNAIALYTFLVKHAGKSNTFLTMVDYNLDANNFVFSEGIAYSVNGNVITVGNSFNRSKVATISFKKARSMKNIVARSGLSIQLIPLK